MGTIDAPREAAGRIGTWFRAPFVFGLFLAVFLACYFPVLNQNYGSMTIISISPLDRKDGR